ncbi:hypothetical protein F0344_34270 [Streptomyces finlayi]|uniref:Alpha/beta hydrolase n=1 Tax=Streptomyces finlayi TaxID=67296 RepID=A0A7G7BUF9_9ACTN|nr:hypothetical protein [Streptomyces finlayi]QNE73250.1 hypothetical protein F0344_00090 [Streptomyces finlayi]QNE78974.1 hypothetical protein F0344_34270 [Streptomyces finlayi]
MDAKIVERKGLQLAEDPRLLSPPRVDQPVYQCATSVVVFDYVPGADVEVEVDGVGAPVVNGGCPWPLGVTVPLPGALAATQEVRARQTTATAQSDWSAPVTVRDHTVDFPAGPPRPQINPAPVHACGVRTGVTNLLTGGNVWITANGTEVGRQDGCGPVQGVDVSPAYALAQQARAWFELCGDPSPPSVGHNALFPPQPLPAPTVDSVYGSDPQQVVVHGVVNGAKVTVYRGGTPLGTWGCWGGTLAVGGLGPFTTAEPPSATQAMCPEDPPSLPGIGTVLPCSSLPPPQVGPVQAGDAHITLSAFVPGAVVRAWLDGTLVGVGGGPMVTLTKTVAHGDTLHVVQDLGGCYGLYAVEIRVACVDPPSAGNPSWLDLFPVGRLEYGVGGNKGSVYYPAQDDGVNQPFNQRLSALGRVPIVFMAHGMHSASDPSYLGYDYFQHDLAKMGVIAVSIDCNALNNGASGFANIEDRADLIIENIKHFQAVDADPGSMFHHSIDFGRVGLMGHSRAGEAVVIVPSLVSLPGVTIRSALSLAPTNWANYDGLPSVQPAPSHAFMTLLPAGDGDVSSNNGAQFYDLAAPGPFKSQQYVDFTNHNFFNRQWLDDDSLWTPPQPAVIDRADHERILAAYGCALYRSTLLGHGSATAYLDGSVLPAGVLTHYVHLAFARQDVLTVDNHQDGNTIEKNSLGRPTAQLSGLSADEFPFQQVPGAFNDSFYGETTGMVALAGAGGRTFRSELTEPTDLVGTELWIRAAEVTDGSQVPPGATGFELGVEDTNGNRAWLDSDVVGGLPRPYPRNPGLIKSMPTTLRFHAGCFGREERLRLDEIVAVLIRCNREDERDLAFDDLQIVK